MCKYTISPLRLERKELSNIQQRSMHTCTNFYPFKYWYICIFDISVVLLEAHCIHVYRGDTNRLLSEISPIASRNVFGFCASSYYSTMSNDSHEISCLQQVPMWPNTSLWGYQLPPLTYSTSACVVNGKEQRQKGRDFEAWWSSLSGPPSGVFNLSVIYMICLKLLYMIESCWYINTFVRGVHSFGVRY